MVEASKGPKAGRPSGKPMRLVSLGRPDARLQLSDGDKRAIKIALVSTSEWAEHVADLPQARTYRAPPSDSGLPDGNVAARRVINALESMLDSVESSASSKAHHFKNLRSSELKTQIDNVHCQLEALAIARAAVSEVGTLREGVARIEAHSSVAGRPVRDGISSAVIVLDATTEYLKKHLEEDLLPQSSSRRRGKPVDVWREELIMTLGKWWLGQGWNPTAKKDRAFARVVAILLDANARRHGKQLAKNHTLRSLRLAEPLRRLKAMRPRTGQRST